MGGLSRGAGQNFRYPDDREILPVAALALRILAPAPLERDDLGAAGLLDDLADHARSLDARGADLMGRAVEQRQNFVEHDPFARLTRQRHDRDLVVGGNFVLFAAGLDDCEHRFIPVFRPARYAQVARPASWQLLTETAGSGGARGLAARFRGSASKPKARLFGRARAKRTL